jgi:outer membrane immunogenic protein
MRMTLNHPREGRRFGDRLVAVGGCMSRVAFAAALAACVGMSSAVLATDLSLKDPPTDEYAPVPIWSGLYFGVHLGGARGNVDVSDTFDYNGDPHAENTVDTLGVIAGIQVGYNFQRGNFVYGVEADLGYLDLSGSKYFDLPNPTEGTNKYDPNREIGATYSFSGGLYGDLTARLGYAADNMLLYVKGGAAFLNVDSTSHYEGANCGYTRTCTGPREPSTFDFEDSEMLLGWTLGVGVEYALSSSLLLKLEYQHFDFGSASSGYKGEDSFRCSGYNWSGTCTSKLEGNSEASVTVDAIKVGLNYQFNRGDDDLK